MKAKWAAVLIAASTFGLMAGQASAQVAGSQTIGVSVEQESIIVNGWSAKKSLLGKPIYNEQGQKVGVLHDIIIAPDNAASFAIVAAHQFLGVSQHDVAVRVGNGARSLGKNLRTLLRLFLSDAVRYDASSYSSGSPSQHFTSENKL